jgi:hypothetical protein
MISLKEGKIYIGDLVLEYADKATVKKEKKVNTRNTLGGTLNTGTYTTGATISVDTVLLPKTLQEVTRLEEIMDAGYIDQIVITGTAYMLDGTPYKRTITGLRATVATDDEEWNPDDGIVPSLEFNVDIIEKESEAI